MVKVPADILLQLRKSGQEHVLAWWDQLSESERRELVDQLQAIHFDQLRDLYRQREWAVSLPAAHRIELNVKDMTQLFNSMDPSPFHEKDLDHDAEEFIVSWAQEFHRKEPIELVVHLEKFPTEHEPRSRTGSLSRRAP